MDKSIDEIYEEMLSVFGEASGYLPSASCDLAARMYAAAAQIQGLYLQAQWLLDQSFPQTAKGEYLERHAQLRGLSRGIATRAAGVLRFGLSTAVGSDLTIKSGTVCMTAAGIRFATTDQAALKSGLLYVDVPAVALEPGKKGNVAAGSVTIMAAMPVGITACTNPAAFSGGDDAEDDEALRRRLLDSYRRQHTTNRRPCPALAWRQQCQLAAPEGSVPSISILRQMPAFRTQRCWQKSMRTCRRSGKFPWICRYWLPRRKPSIFPPLFSLLLGLLLKKPAPKRTPPCVRRSLVRCWARA